MTFVGSVVKCGVVLTAIVAVLIGCLFAGVPGQLGLWKHLDTNPTFKGVVPFIHNEPWGFNHSTLGPDALKGRTILVTGANVGLGLSTVQYLASHGANVILGCRSQSKCNEAAETVKKDAPSVALYPLVLDLGSFKSIKQFAEEVKKTTEKLHSLILNAGIAQYPYGLTEDGLEQHIGVNHFGHAYLVQLLEGMLKKSATKELPATIVVVSSSVHYDAKGVGLSVEALNNSTDYRPDLSYAQSKLANVLYAQELAQRLRPFGILVNSINPGLVATNLGAHIGERFQKDHPIIADVLVKSGVFGTLYSMLTGLIWAPEDAALTQIYAAVSPELISKRIHGKYFHPIARETLPCRVHATNATLQKAFWEFTEEVIKAKAQ